jgi:hypothetical protein
VKHFRSFWSRRADDTSGTQNPASCCPAERILAVVQRA